MQYWKNMKKWTSTTVLTYWPGTPSLQYAAAQVLINIFDYKAENKNNSSQLSPSCHLALSHTPPTNVKMCCCDRAGCLVTNEVCEVKSTTCLATHSKRVSSEETSKSAGCVNHFSTCFKTVCMISLNQSDFKFLTGALFKGVLRQFSIALS